MIIHTNTYRPKLLGRPQHHKVFPKPYDAHQIHLNLDARGELAPNQSFRELLFIALCLSSFMEIDKIQERFEEQFKGLKVAPAAIRKVQGWMEKLNSNPDLKLSPKNYKWREIFLQHQIARQKFLSDFSQEPLAYPRGRFEKLKDLLDSAMTPRITRVAVKKEHLLNKRGTPIFSVGGKALMVEEHIPILEAEVQVAANILKQMGQETGTFVERTEKNVTVTQRVLELRKQRGLNTEGFEDANVISSVPALPSATTVRVEGEQR